MNRGLRCVLYRFPEVLMLAGQRARTTVASFSDLSRIPTCLPGPAWYTMRTQALASECASSGPQLW